ncbi:XdhC family protein [Streptomyces sp. JV176]|uniref:XdhC/CoxI family protein n=1 Tax=Streptomyces sp. JV176 TaxID=858630 RepID=UPI002E79D15F|nr:XdhC/CoxI family protein [Streptomyces sp. JV176]MEE1802787.1 XdhC family protein [Streptomyces sp. JV176]
MRDIAGSIAAWQAAGVRFALATVVRTWKSAPRGPGASMAVAENGEVAGSLSGGCVEGAVYEVAREVLATGEARLTTYGVSDGEALEAGLTCGGIVDILVRPADAPHFPGLPDVLELIAAGRPVAVAVVLPGETGETGAPGGSGDVAPGGTLVVLPAPPPPETPPAPTPAPTLTPAPAPAPGTLGGARLDAAVTERARGLLAQGHTGVVHLGRHGEQRMDDLTVFVQSFAPPPRMLVFGAIDFAGAVARMGKFLGYHVTVCDARPVFATRRRFPDADELVVQWPHRFLAEHPVDASTVICVLTHDPKFDIPLLERALRTPARYIGAMGSRRTHEDRLARLREAGLSEGELARLSSPIGLDLGARTPEETAVAIMAEIIALRWGGTGERLTRTELSIHH